MIQRIQTLFLLQLMLLGVVLMLIPSTYLLVGNESHDLYLLPADTLHYRSSAGHWAAIVLNIVGIFIALVAMFLFKKRKLQRTLCFVLAFLWLVLTLMIAFCPFVESIETPASSTVNYYAVIIGILGVMGSMLSARFIKRDIDLLKSADRIR